MHRLDSRAARARRGDPRRRAGPAGRRAAGARERAAAVGGGRARGRDDHAGGARGRGGAGALPDVLLPADHRDRPPALPRLHPAAPTPASALFDLLVSATLDLRRLVAGGRRRGARRERGAALAGRPRRLPGRRGRLLRPGRHQRQPLRARTPRRERAAPRRRGGRPRRLAARRSAHSSVRSAPRIMDARCCRARRRRRPAARRGAARGADRRATACSPWWPPPARTNLGLVDDLAGVAGACRASAACGCTSTAPTARPACARRASRERFAGIEHADSLIVDPHKWLFAPFDSCALLYREPAAGAGARTARAPPTSTRCTATNPGTRRTTACT